MQDFHDYSQKFGFPGGSNVFTNALEDALRYRGMTLRQFRKEFREKRKREESEKKP